MLSVDRNSINATIYFLEATTAFVVVKKYSSVNEYLEILYKYYRAYIAIFLKVSPIYWIAYVFPRDNNLWVFGSYHNSFDGNAKYLFIYVNQSMPDIKAVWIAKDKQIVRMIKGIGLKAQTKHSLFGYYYTLRASVYFYNNTFCNIDQWNSSGAIRFNLWHGIPLKKIEYDQHPNKKLTVYDGNIKKRVFNIDLYKRHDFVLSTSDAVSNILSGAFKVSQEKCVAFGYPRVEIFLKSKEEVLRFIKAYEPQNTQYLVNKLSCYSKVFVYMPTWRDDGSNFIEASGIDFMLLNEVLKANNYLFLFKFHHHTKIGINTNLSNIILLDNNLDIYTILPFTDYLITDYSSIYFEYLLLNKEVLFFCFDLEDYLKRNRKMYFDYESITPGRKIYNFKELVELIESKENLRNLDYSKQRQELLDKLWIKNTKESSKNIVNFVDLMLKAGLC
jgi:CDP-glycerol glycerophosphotransferase (TagB/SpsB family)